MEHLMPMPVKLPGGQLHAEPFPYIVLHSFDHQPRVQASQHNMLTNVLQQTLLPGIWPLRATV